MIEKLSLHDAEWRKVAFQICGCKDMADELVQEMYLKLYQSDKEINAAYIYFTLRSLFIQKKRVPKFRNVIFIEDLTNDFESDTETYDETQAQILEEIFLSLKWYEKQIIYHSAKIGAKRFSEKSGISVSTIRNVKQKLWQQIKSKDLEMSSQQLRLLSVSNLVQDARKDDNY